MCIIPTSVFVVGMCMRYEYDEYIERKRNIIREMWSGVFSQLTGHSFRALKSAIKRKRKGGENDRVQHDEKLDVYAREEKMKAKKSMEEYHKAQE